MGLLLPYPLVLIMVVHVHLAVSLFLNSCPDKMMWNLRGKDLCGAIDKYMCLYDTNKRKFRELCKDKPEFHRPGNIFVISGNLKYFAARPCKGNRYQPHKWWTNGSSECQYIKSTCNEEGQVPYDNGTVTNNIKCRCDYTNYYTFSSNTSHKCYCDTTTDDCSCNRKICNEDQVLTPDYDCVSIHEWTGRYVCPEYIPPKFIDKALLQSGTKKCPKIIKDFSGTIQQKLTRMVSTVAFGIIVILGLLAVSYVVRKSSRDEIKKVKVDMQVEGLANLQKVKDEVKDDAQTNIQKVKSEVTVEAHQAIEKVRKEMQDEAKEKIRKVKEEMKSEALTEMRMKLQAEEDRLDIYKIRLLKNYHEIVKDIVVTDIVKKISNDVLSTRDEAEIQSMLTQTQKTRKLIDILMNTDERGYHIFFKALTEDKHLKHLAKRINETIVMKNESIRDFRFLLMDPMPQSTRTLHNMMIDCWKEDIDTDIVYSEAILNLYSTVHTEDAVLIVGPRGCGKSSALHCVAFLLMVDGDYEIIPCEKPADILRYLNPTRNQVFIFDDICETTSTTVSFIGEWNKQATIIKSKTNTTEKSVEKKMLFSFDVIAFNTVRTQNQRSSILTESYLFDMLADINRLTENDISEIARKYDVIQFEVTEVSSFFCFFPEICSRYRSFKNKGDIDIMSLACQIIDDFLKELTDDDLILLATLSLFVIYDNIVTNRMLKEIIQDKLHDIAHVINASKSSLSISAIELKLASLTGSYITEVSGRFTVINDDMFKGIVSFFYHHYFYFILEVSPLDSFTFKSKFWLDFIRCRIGSKMLIDDKTADFYYTELLDKVKQSDHVKTKNRNVDELHSEGDLLDG